MWVRGCECVEMVGGMGLSGHDGVVVGDSPRVSQGGCKTGGFLECF
jgi:hypothetical protein